MSPVFNAVIKPRLDTIKEVDCVICRSRLRFMLLCYPNPMQEVQMNLTKALTVPYSASKTPTVNDVAKSARRRICL